VKGRRESREFGAGRERNNSKRTFSVCMKMLDTRGHERTEREREREREIKREKEREKCGNT